MVRSRREYGSKICGVGCLERRPRFTGQAVAKVLWRRVCKRFGFSASGHFLVLGTRHDQGKAGHRRCKCLVRLTMDVKGYSEA